MIEYYSKNQVLPLTESQATNVPFAVRKLQKGCTIVMSGDSAQIQKCGVYYVEFDASFTASAATNLIFTLYVDGVAQPESTQTVTVSATDTYCTSHFSTYVQKRDNNCNCNPCTAPTSIYVTVTPSATANVTFETTKLLAYKTA